MNWSSPITETAPGDDSLKRRADQPAAMTAGKPIIQEKGAPPDRSHQNPARKARKTNSRPSLDVDLASDLFRTYTDRGHWSSL